MTNPPTTMEIRLYVDGELTPEESVRLESLIESDEALRQRVDFERKLKGHISDVIARQAGAAPGELASQIRAKLDQTDRTVVGSISPQPRSAWLGDPKRANIFAVAATLMIVAGAVLFGIFGRSIDDIRPVPNADVISDSAQFVADEHNRCADDEDTRKRKFSRLDPAQAYTFIAKHIGTPSVPEFDLTSIGYSFVGGGKCGVPAADRSAHVMFHGNQTTDGEPPMVSIFIMRDQGQFTFSSLNGGLPGRWVEYDGFVSGSHSVFGTSNGPLVFFLVCGSENDIKRIADVFTKQMTTP